MGIGACVTFLLGRWISRCTGDVENYHEPPYREFEKEYYEKLLDRQKEEEAMEEDQ